MNQVRFRAVFLGLDVVNSFHTSWNHPNLNHKQQYNQGSLTTDSKWNLLILIRLNSALGVFRDEDGNVVWEDIVMASDVFSAAIIFFTKLVILRRNIQLLAEVNDLFEAIDDPINSPWKHRFQARQLSSLCALLKVSYTHSFDSLIQTADTDSGQ